MRYSYSLATKEQVLEWLRDGVFRVTDDGRIFKGEREICQSLELRKRSDRGDPRVSLYHEGFRKSMLVSHLVWMESVDHVVPDGWEIHHNDEDPTNNTFSNLVCLHPKDHAKLHRSEEVPF